MSAILQLPFLAFIYILPKYRQVRDWSYRQALTNRFVKSFLIAFVGLRVKPSLSLGPGLEGERFVLIEPANPDVYTGIVADQQIHPETIGGTWYPTPFSPEAVFEADKHVVLHFHGGSYILGDGRTATCRYLAKEFLKHTPTSYIFCPQYRLACNHNGRFPAQLQDAASSYCYLIHGLRIPASKIVLSGDSCGGHLVLSLLRYIRQLDNASLLPAPKCNWVFSPWCDVPAATDRSLWENSPHYETEFIPSSFPAYGAKQYLKGLEITQPIEQYVAPIRHPFVVPSPVLIITGGREVLFEEHERLAREFQRLRENESRIGFFWEERIPHDVLMVGWIMDFRDEGRRCACEAGKFVNSDVVRAGVESRS